MAITAFSALWFLPFVLPICLYVAYTDLAHMRITNKAVAALTLVFLLVGLIALPFDIYLWRLLYLVIVLVVGIILNAVGAMGAGDSKFLAASAPFVALGDLRLLMVLLMACVLFAFVVHRGVKMTPIRQLVPHWESWNRKKFPMGFALGPTLTLYLVFGAFYGA